MLRVVLKNLTNKFLNSKQAIQKFMLNFEKE